MLFMPTHREVLEWEIQWTGQQAVKQAAVEVRFGLSLTRYIQILNEAIDDTELLEAYPQDVYRMRSVRAARVNARAARVLS